MSSIALSRSISVFVAASSSFIAIVIVLLSLLEGSALPEAFWFLSTIATSSLFVYLFIEVYTNLYNLIHRFSLNLGF